MSSIQTGRRPNQGNVTLESLLDSPGLTPSPLSDFINGADGEAVAASSVNGSQIPASAQMMTSADRGRDDVGATNQPSEVVRISETQRRAFLRDICSELLCVLRMQDVNGYFLSVPCPRSLKLPKEGVGLIQLEKRLLRNEYDTLNDYKTGVLTLFHTALRVYPPESVAHSEAQRLLGVSSDWFASLPEENLCILNTASGESLSREQPDSGHRTTVNDGDLLAARDTHLAILNPDNHGFVSRTERVRSIGDEAGQLRQGCSLLTGGYREDRRNKVIPYTYLDYGPYYSFAPTYDSGASHCTPEANQLLLSTTWLPSRTAYLPRLAADSPFDVWNGESSGDGDVDDEISKSLNSEPVVSALAIDDHPLAVSLAVADMEVRATNRILAELDDVLPGPEVDDDCVYSMCLANALTRDALRLHHERVERESMREPKTIADLISDDSCDLDQHSGDIVELNVPDGSEDDEPDTPSWSTSVREELSQSAMDLRALYCAQYHRLGHITPVAGGTLRPSTTETTVARRLVDRLTSLAQLARPRDLVHPYAVRTAMGIQPPDRFPLTPDDDDEAPPVGRME